LSQILNAAPTLITSVPSALGEIPWSSPEQANANDGNYAQCAFTPLVIDQRSEQLRATGYDFSEMGDDDMPVAIEVTVDRRLVGDDVQDASVRLVLNGATIGDDRAILGEWPATDTEIVYGAVDDDWLAGLTAAVVKDPTFGVQIVVASAGGGAPKAQVDSMLMSLYFLPATLGSSLSSRVQEMVRSLNPAREGPSTLEADAALSEAYMHVGAIMPQTLGERVGSLVIESGSATFQLPTTDADRDSVVQYDGEVSLRRTRDGRFLFRISNEEMDRKTDGFGSRRLGTTVQYFSLYEDAEGVVQGRCFPRPTQSVECDIFSATLMDDPRDAADFDAIVQALAPIAQAAVVYRAAGMLVAASSHGRRAGLRVTNEGRKWVAIGDRLAQRAAVRAHDMASVGRLIREQYQKGPTHPSAVGGVTTVEAFPTTEFGVIMGNVLEPGEEE
jgi:hypothetical protein